MRFTPSTNYNQFLPSPDLNYSRYGIVHSERLGYQLWQRPLKFTRRKLAKGTELTGWSSTLIGQKNIFLPNQRDGIRPLFGTGSVRISSQGLFRSWSKLSPENIASFRLVAPGSPRMIWTQLHCLFFKWQTFWFKWGEHRYLVVNYKI